MTPEPTRRRAHSPVSRKRARPQSLRRAISRQRSLIGTLYSSIACWIAESASGASTMPTSLAGVDRKCHTDQLCIRGGSGGSGLAGRFPMRPSERRPGTVVER